MKKAPVPVAKRVRGKLGGQPIEEVTRPFNRPGLIRLTDREPEIALEWYYPKNCGFGPEDFSYGSKVNAWWQCSRNPEHIWRTKILSRCSQKRGCPQCFGTNLRVPVPFERSLACLDPALALEWHSTKNNDLTPSDVLLHSKTIVWWQCPRYKKHSWQLDVSRRVTERTSCSLCHAAALLTLDKYPEALKFYDLKKNMGYRPELVCGRDIVWWRCPAAPDHSWKAVWNPRKNWRCPFCCFRKVSSTSSLLALFPKVAAEFHPTRNGKKTAADVRAFGKEAYWWRCRYNPRHCWEARIDNRTRLKSGCPDCWKIRRPRYFKRLAAERKLNADHPSEYWAV